MGPDRRFGLGSRFNDAEGLASGACSWNNASSSRLHEGFNRQEPECDSSETRSAVLQTISDDHSNALVDYAARHPSTAKSSATSPEAEKQRPLYLLGEQIVTTSTSENKQTLKCSGSISVTVGDTKASKEINFTAQKSSDGKLSVSVAPFQF
jgi:hypothetical protein